MSDPWAPWAKCDQAALGRVFDVLDFEGQVAALLELNPHASAKEIAALPWDERHEAKEFRRVRDAWVAERAVKREHERAQNEKPLPDVVRERLDAAVRTGNTKEAKDLLEIESKIAGSKAMRAEIAKEEDDFSRLSDIEVLALAALCHKLRDEPLTEVETGLLAVISQLGTTDESADKRAS